MQRREKILIFGFLAVIVVGLGLPKLKETFYAPLEELESRRQAIALKVEQKEAEQDKILRATAKLKQWKSESLPPNDLDAQRLYQQWLTDLAQTAGFGNLKVTAGRRMGVGRGAIAVQVGIDGDATLRELTWFLDQFRKTALVQRIVQISTESPAHNGDPRLKVMMVAEGLSLTDVPDRKRLFPVTQLQEPLKSQTTEWTVNSADGFPGAAGFRVRIGNELAMVTGIDGHRWKVARGIDGTVPREHSSGAFIELAPVRELPPSEDLKTWLARSPFATPEPPRRYEPQLASVSGQTAVRGTPWALKLAVTGADPSLGAPIFELTGNVPTGLTLNGETGEMTWTPEETADLKSHSFGVQARWPNSTLRPLSRLISITVKDSNQAPTVASVPSQTVFAGRSLSLTLKASDDGPASSIRFQAGDGAPAGLTVDSTSGEVTWTPPETFDGSEATLPIVVTDQGTPPRSTTISIPVAIREDSAQYTFLVASVVQAGQSEAWLYDRANNQRTVLRTGSSFQVADLIGRVRKIERDSVELEIDRGLWRLGMGMSLRAMTSTQAPPLTATPRTATEPAVAEIPTASQQAPVTDEPAIAETP